MGWRRLAIGLPAALALASVAYWIYERPRSIDVPFRSFVVPPAVDYSPAAPDGFPDCTRDMLDLRIEDTHARLDVTYRPKPGIQCGMPVYPRGWWIDGNGERFEGRPRDARQLDGRLLLHGANGADDGGGIASGCTIEAPVTYFIELAGKAIEIGTIEKKLECNRDRNRIYATSMLGRPQGLETPAGSLDGAMDQVRAAGDLLTFNWSMRNDTHEDITISRCPILDVEFQSGEVEREGRGFRTYLNCLDAPDVVEPGDVLHFAIEAPIAELGIGDVLEVELRDESRVLYRVSEDVAL